MASSYGLNSVISYMQTSGLEKCFFFLQKIISRIILSFGIREHSHPQVNTWDPSKNTFNSLS